MALASLWGGIVLANAGLGAVHGLVAPLGGRCAIPHGIGCACLLVETMRGNLEALRSRAPKSPALLRYEEIARALGAANSDAALDELASLRSNLGVKTLASFGLTPEEIAPIVANSRGGSMRFNPVELTDAELEAILRSAMRADP
jgi:alcohol dehydrogenase class IV